MNIPGIFLDSDVVFAGPASPSEHGASHVILCMGEISLIECIVSRQVVVEVERNLAAKLPAKLPVFRQIMKHALLVVRDTLSAELVHSRILFLPADFQSPTLPPHFKQAHGSAARRISLFYQTDALHLCHEIVSPGSNRLAGLTL